MKQEKKYQLIWVSGNSKQYIMEGTASLLNFKKQQIKHNYKTGKLIIISNDGINYHLNKDNAAK